MEVVDLQRVLEAKLGEKENAFKNEETCNT